MQYKLCNSLTAKEVPPFRQVDIQIDITVVNKFYDMLKKSAAEEKALDVSFEKMAFSWGKVHVPISVIVIEFPFKCYPLLLLRNYKIDNGKMI